MPPKPNSKFPESHPSNRPPKNPVHPNYQEPISYKPEFVTQLSLSNGQMIDVLEGSFEERWINHQNRDIQVFSCRDQWRESLVIHGLSENIIAMWVREPIEDTPENVDTTDSSK